MSKFLKCLIFTLSIVAPVCNAQPGHLDPTYGQGGYKVLETRVQSIAHSTIMLPDNKILITGVWGGKYVIFECNAHGEIDPDFGIQEQGKMEDTRYNPLSAIALQSDGSIIIANRLNNKLAVYRYNAVGDMDYTFGINGIVQIKDTFSVATSVLVQPDDKILVAYRMGKIIRLTVNGGIDSSWGKNGIVAMPDTTIDIVKILAQPDGKIIAVGENTNTVRLHSDGSIDNSFGINGMASISFDSMRLSITTATIQPDGKILMAGSVNKGTYTSNRCDYFMLRFDADGRPDMSFGKIGVAVSKLYRAYFNKFYSLCLQKDGKIIAGGTTFDGGHYKMLLMRFLPDGNIDFSFGYGLGYTAVNINSDQDDICAVAIQNDGKIVAAGSTLLPARRKNMVVARFDNDNVTKINDVFFPKPSLHPNPASDVLNITINDDNRVKYSISNTMGQIVQQGELVTKQIDISMLSNGIYVLQLRIAGSDPITMKFTKQE